MSGTVTDTPVPEKTIISLGTILIGGMISYLLMGITVMQLYLYHNNFPNDSKRLKILVYVVFFLDVLQSADTAGRCWHEMVEGWGRSSVLRTPDWTFSMDPMVTGITAAIVQIFYAWRIHILDKWIVIPSIITVLALTQCAASWAAGIGFIPVKDTSVFHETTFNARIFVWLIGSAVTDVLICASMFYWFLRWKHFGFSATQTLLKRVIRITIETGLVTATFAILGLITFAAFPPDIDVHNLIFSFLCKLYSNALLTSLNSRNQYTFSGSERSSQLNRSALIWSTTGTNTGTVPNFNTHSNIGMGLGAQKDLEGGMGMGMGGRGNGGAPVIHVQTTTTRAVDLDRSSLPKAAEGGDAMEMDRMSRSSSSANFKHSSFVDV